MPFCPPHPPPIAKTLSLFEHLHELTNRECTDLASWLDASLIEQAGANGILQIVEHRVTVPSGRTLMLAGLSSRWTIPLRVRPPALRRSAGRSAKAGR